MIISGKIQAFAIGVTAAAMMLCYNTEAAKASNNSTANVGKFFQRAERSNRVASSKQVAQATKIAGLWNWRANSSKSAALGLNGAVSLNVTEDGGVTGKTSIGRSATKVNVQGNAVVGETTAAIRFTIQSANQSYVVEANLSADGTQLIGAIQEASASGDHAAAQVFPFVASRNVPVAARR